MIPSPFGDDQEARLRLIGFDVVIAGAGHNALIAGCYRAKAGLRVCIAEANEKAGGAVSTAEVTGPGFKQDICSVSHAMLMGNP